jgi:hypothetical protein
MKKINFNDIEQKMKSDARSISNNINIDVHDEVLNNITQLAKQKRRQQSPVLFRWLLPLGVAASALIILSLNYTETINVNHETQHSLAQQESNRLEHQAIKQDIQYLSQIFAL